MKHLFFTIAIVLLGLAVFAQEVQFPSAIISAGGGGSIEDNSISFSRWRIGQVHVITLPDDLQFNNPDELNQDWNVSIFPNPAEDFLYLEFEVPEEKELCIKITDISGRVLFIQEARTFINGSTDEIDMSRYVPALYLLQISSPDLKSQKIYRVQKL